MEALMRKLCGAVPAALAVLIAALATPALAGTVYSWRTEDGTYAFSDDPGRIPERYRSQARARDSGALGDYAQLTRSDGGDAAVRAAQLERRLERLRAMNGYRTPRTARGGAGAVPPVRFVARPLLRPHPLEVLPPSEGEGDDAAAAGGPVRASRVRATDEFVPAVNFNVDPDDPAPVIVEKKRMRDRDSMSTRHVTIIRQGDRVLGLIKPRSHVEPPYWGDEEDLER